MKGGSSSLNPYATSYVPLSERGGTDDINDFRLLSNQLDSGNHSVWFGHQPNLMCTQGQHQNLSQSYVNGADAVQAAQISNPKDHCGGEFYAPSSYNPYEMSGKSRFSEESDMDLAYLQMTFPGISEESLSDVYLANKWDLDSTVDMLNQLEVGFVTAICFTCFLIRCFVVGLSAFDSDASLEVLDHPILNLIYYMLVEILPSALVLYILRKLPPKRVSAQYHPIR